jgi:THAP domain/Zinc-finger associated domain (zf-AD)
LKQLTNDLKMGCSVVGCSSRTTPSNKKRFFLFPNNQTIRQIWKTFTRRGRDFVIKDRSSYVCEDHFNPSCFVLKKKSICLAKDTIPTIFYRKTPEGETEKIVLTFDQEIMHYDEEDTLLSPADEKKKLDKKKSGGRSCTVVDCPNRSNMLIKKRFFGFPTDQTIRDVWATFTRRGADFAIKKGSSYICEDHFDSSSFVFKKTQDFLSKEAIPTIFHRVTPEGESERIVLTFDREIMHYIEKDTLLNPVYDKEKREEELAAKRERKLKEIGKLCRFCLEDRNEENLIEISKLKDYSIKPAEVMSLVGLNTQYSELFSNNACEECFQQIFVFDGYRKRCQKAQDRMVSEMKELDQEIQKICGGTGQGSWLKAETTNWNDDCEDDENMMNETVESTRLVTPVKKTADKTEFHKIIVKEEREDEMSDDDYYQDYQDYVPSVAMDKTAAADDDEDDDFVAPNLPLKTENIPEPEENSDAGVAAIKTMTKYEDGKFDLKDVFMPDRSQGNCRIYECFFCRLVS